MDNVELSPATRWGMIATGLLQGLVCYLLIAWLAGKNLSWMACPPGELKRRFGILAAICC